MKQYARIVEFSWIKKLSKIRPLSTQSFNTKINVINKSLNKIIDSHNILDTQIQTLKKASDSSFSALSDEVDNLSKMFDTIKQCIENINERTKTTIRDKEDPEYIKLKYAREIKVREINLAADEKMRSVYRRDAYYINKMNITSVSDAPLTNAELKAINDFWAPYSFAYKNNPETQRVISRITNRFDPSYIGFGLQRYSMVRFWNHPTYTFISNKNSLPWYFTIAKQPRTYIHAAWGQLSDENRNPITFDECIDICHNILQCNGERIIVKPDEGMMGAGIQFLENGASKETISAVLRQYKDNFLCQQVITNHPSFSAPHPQSLNTLRISTLWYKGVLHWVGTAFRMGVTGNVDNWSQGGIACAVNEDGVCGDFACTEDGHVYRKHPDGFEFSGHKLYNYKLAHELAFKLHRLIPQQKYIAWDITIDKFGEPVLIECNSPGSSELMQAVGFNAYINKEIAKEIFDEYLVRRFYYVRANFDWDYREFSTHISLIKYCGFDSIVNVPKEINGKPVTLLYKNAIVNKNIIKVIIPSDVFCEEGAISGCSTNCIVIHPND